MDDFEYSVEICDRDWESFYTECEECDLLPPSLAGVDDSGMSDIDEIGSLLAQRAQRVESKQGSSENDCPIDGPLDRGGSPLEHCMAKRGLGAVESVLSGSEEDIHLQSVNIFFERLKSLTDLEPNSKKVGNKREIIQEEERRSGGQQASGATLPKNFPNLNTPPARGETAVGKEIMQPVNTIRTISTMKKVEAESNISPEPAACRNSAPSMCRPVETELFIREEACTETSVNDVIQWNQSCGSTDAVICSETPQTCSMEKCTNLSDMKEEGLLTSQVILRKKSCPREDHGPTQESSPSASIKRKRRKKRRLSVEVGEGGKACERQVIPARSESEEEHYGLREGSRLRLFEESLTLNEPQKSLMHPLAAYSVAANFPDNISNKHVKNELSLSAPPSDSQYQHLPQTVFKQRKWTATDPAENNTTDHMSVSLVCQSDGNIMSTVNNSAIDTTRFQPCSKLHAELLPRLNEYSGLSVSITEDLTGKSEHQKQDAKAGDLQQSDKINASFTACENGQNVKHSVAEVKSVSILQSAESCAPAVDISQNEKLSTAKTLLASEAGNSGRDEHTLCQSETEPQHQLESDCHNTNQCGTTMEKNHFPLSATAGITSHTVNTKSPPLKTRACPVTEEIPSEVMNPDLTLGSINQSPLTKNLCSLDPKHQADLPMEVQAVDILSTKNTKAEATQLETSKTSVLTSNNQTDTKQSLSEDLQTTLSDITQVSSCCTLDTESLMSLSNENLTDMSASFCSSAGEHESEDQTEKNLLMLVKQEGDGPINHLESTCDLLSRSEDGITVSKAAGEPEQMVNSVFAMSSFWSEMEKLTINDILGLRKISKTAPLSSLPPVQENEETDVFTAADSGIFTQVDESGPAHTKEETSPTETYYSRSVMWESESVPASGSVDIYPEKTILAAVTDTFQPVLTEKTQKCLRKISKTITVHNLQALESDSHTYTCKGEALHTLEEGESGDFMNFTEASALKPDKKRNSLLSSFTDSYSISLTDIFQYFFGGKQSVPSQSARDDITTVYTAGNSIPETYDHFFSEFDTENFFYPLTTAEEKDKDKPVPIFSYSRSASRNLQFPEAYEYFYASSSSDDSSVESDEEENFQPVRVLSRFNHKPSSSQISTDIYDDFFTDCDLRQNFFSLRSLSFRNIHHRTSTVQKQASHSMSLVPVSQRSSSPLEAGLPLSALGNQDVMTPDPLLYHLDDRISRILAEQPFKHDGFQEIISNPRLDASLLPIRQSDMCLVCIAFASWVLKTANPQVGDAWKAVLLANVSALSAIRYLRKYVKVEAAASEMKLQHALPDS